MTKKAKLVTVCAVTAIVVAVAVILPVTLYCLGIIDYAQKAESTGGKYLMAYFTGNEPEQERICFAVSDDGYMFTPLNDNLPVLEQTLGTGSARDPYLFRAENGTYYILATDMRSEDGWSSNHRLIVWHSNDLLDWEEVGLIDMRENGLPDTVRAWAPQAIWDEEKGAYMLYWANCENSAENGWSGTVMWYAYTNDFKELISAPEVLFAPPGGKDAIDADIIKKDGIYYMYYKDENESKICYATATSPSGPYTLPDDPVVSVFYTNVEGNFIYNITGTDSYVMMLDCYSKGNFVLQQTEDMTTFKRVNPSDYDFSFSPRHGSVMSINDTQYEALIGRYGK